MPSERSVSLKAHHELLDIAEKDENSTTKYEANYVDDYYPNRPACLEELCYYEFRRLYEKCKNPDKQFRFLNSKEGVKLRSDPFLISFTIFKKPEEVEKYQYSLLLLFKPFRSESELLDANGKCAEIFRCELEKNELLRNRHTELQKQMVEVETSKEEAKKILEQSLTPDDSYILEPEEAAPTIAQNVVDELLDVMAVRVSGQEPMVEELVASMNSDQERVYQFLTNQLSNRDESGLLMFLSGAGGTGIAVCFGTTTKIPFLPCCCRQKPFDSLCEKIHRGFKSGTKRKSDDSFDGTNWTKVTDEGSYLRGQKFRVA